MGNATAANADQAGLLKIERSGAVLTVGLNRPAKRNALNDGIILEIGECFAKLPDDIGAVVIHGIGDHFSSGLDLSELTEQDRLLRRVLLWLCQGRRCEGNGRQQDEGAASQMCHVHRALPV